MLDTSVLSEETGSRPPDPCIFVWMGTKRRRPKHLLGPTQQLQLEFLFHYLLFCSANTVSLALTFRLSISSCPLLAMSLYPPSIPSLDDSDFAFMSLISSHASRWRLGVSLLSVTVNITILYSIVHLSRCSQELDVRK